MWSFPCTLAQSCARTNPCLQSRHCMCQTSLVSRGRLGRRRCRPQICCKCSQSGSGSRACGLKVKGPFAPRSAFLLLRRHAVRSCCIFPDDRLPPVYTGKERWQACGWTAAVLVLSFATTMLLVVISYLQRDLDTAMSGKDKGEPLTKQAPGRSAAVQMPPTAAFLLRCRWILLDGPEICAGHFGCFSTGGVR